jgi:hypothetical protein
MGNSGGTGGSDSPRLVWPTSPDVLPGRDWRETVRTAGDLALAGILVSAAAVPIVTAGAAFATASWAIHHLLEDGRWPSFNELTSYFRRRLMPGLWAGPVFLAGALLVALDVAALRHGAVPGGAAMICAVLLVALLGTGWVALRVVSAGRPVPVSPRPAPLAAAAGIVLLVTVLSALVHPVLVPVLIGFALYALHVTANRLSP